MSTARRLESDQGFIPMKTINDMKRNTELVAEDYVVVSEDLSVYKIVTSQQKIRLDNLLYAEKILSGKELENYIKNLQNEKYDKAGGDISGNVSVNGSVACRSINLNGYNITVEQGARAVNLKFLNADEEHLFPTRNIKTESYALNIDDKYIDLTTQINLSSFSKVNLDIGGVTYYLRDRYFNENSSATENYNNKAYKPSRPITHTISIPIGEYPKYKISINGNFDVMSWFDFNNSSWFDNSHFKGNFSTPISPVNGSGHGWAGYTVTQVTDPNGFNMSYPVETMNGELNLTGNISDLTSSDKEIFYRQMTNSIGEGTAAEFKVNAKVESSNLIITYGWWLTGYDERCNGNVSYSIKIGVCTHE